jgi:hypothetical protein
MTLSKNELIDMIERIDEIAANLDEFRHRFVQELEDVEQQKGKMSLDTSA